MCESKYVILKDAANTLKDSNILKIIHNEPVYRIKAVRDFGNVRRGDLGGYVASYDNLSMDGNCWIYDDAVVAGGARIWDDAEVRESAVVCDYAVIDKRAFVTERAIVKDFAIITDDSLIADKAVIAGNSVVSGSSCVDRNANIEENSQIMDNARVTGAATIKGSAVVKDDAIVDSTATVDDSSVIFDNAHIGGGSYISGKANIGFNGKVNGDSDYMCIGPVGEKGFDNYITFYKTGDNGINFVWGTWKGAFENFTSEIKRRYGVLSNGNLRNKYLGFAKLVKAHLS